MLAAARADGLPITVETCPHYLTFAAERDSRRRDRVQVRAADPRARTTARRCGRRCARATIELVATDHSPCPPAMKAADGRLLRGVGRHRVAQLVAAAVWTGRARAAPLDDARQLDERGAGARWPASTTQGRDRAGHTTPTSSSGIRTRDFVVDPRAPAAAAQAHAVRRARRCAASCTRRIVAARMPDAAAVVAARSVDAA